jgi:6-pyruvoyl-tetrahydropterin synthase
VPRDLTVAVARLLEEVETLEAELGEWKSLFPSEENRPATIEYARHFWRETKRRLRELREDASVAGKSCHEAQLYAARLLAVVRPFQEALEKTNPSFFTDPQLADVEINVAMPAGVAAEVYQALKELAKTEETS